MKNLYITSKYVEPKVESTGSNYYTIIDSGGVSGSGVTQKYVDDALSRKVNITGDTMTGALINQAYVSAPYLYGGNIGTAAFVGYMADEQKFWGIGADESDWHKVHFGKVNSNNRVFDNDDLNLQINGTLGITNLLNAATGYTVCYNPTTKALSYSQGSSAIDGVTYNATLGIWALHNSSSTGYYNVAIGAYTAQLKTNDSSLLTPQFSTYIGSGIKGSATGGNIHEIVIGANAKGNGNYTVTLGNDEIDSTLLKGKVGCGKFPYVELDVSGNINVTGEYRVNGVDILTTFDGSNYIQIPAVGDNTVFGYRALYLKSTAADNVAIGHLALYSCSTGYHNIGIGYQALYKTSTGNGNVAIGNVALYTNTSGHRNFAVGEGAMYYNTTGYYNNGQGVYALSDNTTGIGNIGLGYHALRYNVAGGYNIALGYLAGKTKSNNGDNTTPNYSIYIGYDARGGVDTSTNEVVIGKNAIGNGSNTITLGNLDIQRTIINGSTGFGGKTDPSFTIDVSGNINITGTYKVNGVDVSYGGACKWNASGVDINYLAGKVAIGKTTASYPLDVSGNIYSSGVISANSDIRYKDILGEIEEVLPRYDELTPFVFKFKGETVIQYGYSAQELLKVFPRTVHYDEKSDTFGVNSLALNALNTKAIKELKSEIYNLRSELDSIKELLNKHNLL